MGLYFENLSSPQSLKDLFHTQMHLWEGAVPVYTNLPYKQVNHCFLKGLIEAISQGSDLSPDSAISSVHNEQRGNSY
jgi:hypothetical protein